MFLPRFTNGDDQREFQFDERGFLIVQSKEIPGGSRFPSRCAQPL